MLKNLKLEKWLTLNIKSIQKTLDAGIAMAHVARLLIKIRLQYFCAKSTIDNFN